MGFVDLVRGDLKTVFLTDFAEPAIWTPQVSGSGDITVNGIFLNPYEDVNLFSNLGVSIDSSEPHFIAAIDDVPNIRIGDTMLIRNITYKVKKPKPEESGLIPIMLTRSNVR